MNKIETLYAGFCLAIYAFFGVVFTLWPTYWAGLTDVVATSPTGTMDLRATYGGLELGISAFLVYAWRSRRYVELLLLATLGLAGLGLGRSIGLLQDGEARSFVFQFVAIEWSGAACGAYLLWRRHRRSAELQHSGGL